MLLFEPNKYLLLLLPTQRTLRTNAADATASILAFWLTAFVAYFSCVRRVRCMRCMRCVALETTLYTARERAGVR